MSTDWTKGLNPEQESAVLHNFGPLLILAGAGSGKTTVIVGRTGRLITEQIVSPKQLCILTFSNKAAEELKSRVQDKLGSAARKIWAGTFHSFGLSLLRRHSKIANLADGFGILDPGDATVLIKEILSDFKNSKSAYDPQKLLSMISILRESRRTHFDRDGEYEEAACYLLPRFLKRLDMLGLVDFDGLILKPIELMRQNKDAKEEIQHSFSQVMVDEFQDTNKMQMELVRVLTDSHKNLSVVGDDDQSIYGWRGAEVSNILHFPKKYPNCTIVRLERNYRSTPAILKIANSVIAKNDERHPKILRPRDLSESGLLPEMFSYANEDEEAESVCNEIDAFIKDGANPNEIAVLYRSNGQGALLEAELRKRNIPYAISGGTAFFDRKETRDLLAYLRCAVKPNEIAFRRIINTPPRGLGDKTIELLTTHSKLKKISFVDATKSWRHAGVDNYTGSAITQFIDELNNLIPDMLSSTNPPGTHLINYLSGIGYRKHIEKYSQDAVKAARRWRFMEMFSGILNRHIDLNGKTKSAIKEFVDAMELRDLLNNKVSQEDKVQLLTLHACKGLEFPIVFVIGVEEDLLPHKILGTNIAEERRLFYVGITRAQTRLILTRAEKRRKHGKMADSPPSRFLAEIPPELIKTYVGGRPMVEEKRKLMVAELFAKLDSLAMKVPQ